MNDVKKACTCPSGEGSLRHPCPAHPPQADNQQSGRVRLGDADPVRSALEDALQFVETLHSTVAGDSRKIVWRCLERGRAALSAQPSPAMESVGKRKLHQLQGDGFIVNGLAIFNPETGRRGLVDKLGYVGWVVQPSPGGQDAPFPWRNFPAYLIDRCEGFDYSGTGCPGHVAAAEADHG